MKDRADEPEKPRPETKVRPKKVISYSKNVFLPITNLCRNDCAYCGFKKEPEEGAWILSPETSIRLAKRGKESGCSEALITLGEKPEYYERMEKKLEKWGYDTTVDYLSSLSRKILDSGLLPHTNPGIMDLEDLKKLKTWNASLGLMLECSSRLKAHSKSPGKDPESRVEAIENAGKLKIPFTTGIMIGIGETKEERMASLEKIKALDEEYGHIQEVIIQPFVPKKGTPMETKKSPDHQTVLETVKRARRLMPDMNLQVPPNLSTNLTDCVEAGANDLGGISEVTPDFINPGNPWPGIEETKSKIEKMGYETRERLPIYPEYVRNSGFMSEEVEKLVKRLRDKNGYRGLES